MEINAIYCGDCKDVLANFPDNSIDLIYVDPPFFTQKNYEIIWGDGYEIRSFKDAQWYGKNGKRREDIYVYLDWLKERINQCYRVLKDTGSFYLHCDWHADAYIRVYILDKIFGKKNFRNEIIWCYKTRHFSKKYFGRKHDTIFFYTKSDDYVFNWKNVLRPLSESTIKKYKYTDEKGRYRLVGRGIKGSPIKSAKDVDPKWEKTHPHLVKRDYLKPGVPIEDYWYIEIINQVSKERLGYPTQKPELLLERIIKASSNPDDIVLDPMCGCGTTIAVCQKFSNKEKRKWIGIDISPTACRLMNDRLRKLGAIPKLIGMPATIKQLKKIQPFDFQNWVIQRLGGRVSSKKICDMGIDGFTFDGTPVQVKQSDRVGRNVVDNFETAIRRYFSGSKRKKSGIIVVFSFTSGAYNEAHRVGLEGDIKIELKTVEELLNEK